MKLTDLEPEWVQDTTRDGKPSHARSDDLNIGNAQGIMFLCPSCFKKNGGPVGTHSILAWFRDRAVPDDRRPGPGRWAVSGSGLNDLTLSPSIDISSNGDGEWHGFITNGEIVGGI